MNIIGRLIAALSVTSIAALASAGSVGCSSSEEVTAPSSAEEAASKKKKSSVVTFDAPNGKKLGIAKWQIDPVDHRVTGLDKSKAVVATLTVAPGTMGDQKTLFVTVNRHGFRAVGKDKRSMMVGGDLTKAERDIVTAFSADEDEASGSWTDAEGFVECVSCVKDVGATAAGIFEDIEACGLALSTGGALIPADVICGGSILLTVGEGGLAYVSCRNCRDYVCSRQPDSCGGGGGGGGGSGSGEASADCTASGCETFGGDCGLDGVCRPRAAQN